MQVWRMMRVAPVSGWVEEVDSPVGSLAVLASATGVSRVFLPDSGVRPPAGRLGELRGDSDAAHDRARDAARQLAEYFVGHRWHVDVPVDVAGTAFQTEVWQALRAIPAGTTVSYGELARRLGRPGAARAVGGANRANPVPIIVPCHRVVAADSHGGYAGGAAMKAWLLAHEGAAGTWLLAHEGAAGGTLANRLAP